MLFYQIQKIAKSNFCSLHKKLSAVKNVHVKKQTLMEKPAKNKLGA